jgi:single-strand DNA-binding protein
VNVCIISGRLAAEPELRATGNGTPVLTFDIAVKRERKNASGEYDSDFIRCVAWFDAAERISRYFHKGQLILISGRLERRSYKDKRGANREIFEITVEKWDFCGGKSENPSQTWWIEEEKRRKSAESVGPGEGFTNAGPEDFDEIFGDEDDLPWPAEDAPPPEEKPAAPKPTEGSQVTIGEAVAQQRAEEPDYISRARRLQEQRQAEMTVRTDEQLAHYLMTAQRRGWKGDEKEAQAEIRKRTGGEDYAEFIAPWEASYGRAGEERKS